jgi:hypothetical protein
MEEVWLSDFSPAVKDKTHSTMHDKLFYWYPAPVFAADSSPIIERTKDSVNM